VTAYKTLVIAGNANEAKYWIIQDLGKKYPSNTSLSMSDYIIISSPDQLRGIRNPTGIFVGNWKQRTDIFELLNMLLVNVMTDPIKHKIIQDLLVQHIIKETK
jgi:hypothetical protein